MVYGDYLTKLQNEPNPSSDWNNPGPSTSAQANTENVANVPVEEANDSPVVVAEDFVTMRSPLRKRQLNV